MKHRCSNNIILIICCLFIIVLGCNEGKQETQLNDQKAKPDGTPTTQKQAGKTTVGKLSSFVLSCGSGCAMTYNPELVTGKLPVIKVKFKVDMFVDEKLTDTYNEVYEFSFDESKSLKELRLEGKTEDALKTLPENAKRSFKEFAYELSNNSGNSKMETTNNAAQNNQTKTFIAPEAWRWRSEDKSREFTIKVLKLTNDSLIAQYCAVYNSGQKLDCDFDENTNIRAAFNNDENAYTGEFKSFFNSGAGTCSLKRTDHNLIWKVLIAPEGEYYASDYCVLVKVLNKK